MPYITREDGQHFVIPSYREVIFAKQKSALKKEVLELSQNYGDYITINRKAPNQYEVAYSPDTGYSLGESVWHHFGRPAEMIYCEAVPDTTEAILVIVKDGSVYLDGSFPVESIPEELVIFLTQQNNFDIYLYGNVPISQKPEEGKFSFDEASVSSFTILEEPVFNTLPLLKAYHFQLVEPALRAHGVGAFPVVPLILVLVGVVGVWMIISFIISMEPPPPPVEVMEPNPYEVYVKELKSPDPVKVLNAVANKINALNSCAGWFSKKITYSPTTVVSEMGSDGNSVEFLMDWAKLNDARVVITTKGISLTFDLYLENRPINRKIYPLNEVLVIFLDRMQKVNAGSAIGLRFEDSRKIKHKAALLTINLKNASPVIVNLIADQLKDLPMVASNLDFKVVNGSVSGTITFKALGS